MPTPISPFQIKSLFFDNGISTSVVECDDRAYMPTTNAWIAGAFTRELGPFLADEFPDGYEEEVGDCDDYNAAAVWKASSTYRRFTPNRPKGTALAVGRFKYVTSRGIAHTIPVFVCRGKSPLRLVWYEPQSLQIVTLTKAEKESCSRVLFMP